MITASFPPENQDRLGRIERYLSNRYISCYRIPEHAVSRHDEGRNEDARAGRLEGGRVDERGYDDEQCGRRVSDYCSNGGNISNGDYLRHYRLILHDSGVANRIDRLECRERNVHVAFHSSQITVQNSSYELSTTHARTSLTPRRTFPSFEHRHAVSHRRRNNNGSFRIEVE